MKHPFTIYDLRFTIWKKSARPSSQSVNPRTPVIDNRQSSIINHQSQNGVALIITIILLGVVTFMAIAFLALSRRERGAVTTVTDTAGARLAADAALASAEAQIVANALSTTNPYNFGLLVSTNYINPYVFQTGNDTNFSDVNYYDPSGNILPGVRFLQNLANLWYSPRPPVFIPNPMNPSLPPDFRFYLDLNRNGRYDTNGWVENFDNNNNDLGTTSFQVGDPEWIGILQRPDQPYGPNNPFVARFAFIAVPVGNTLDLNAIYNQVFDENNGGNGQVNPPPPAAVDGYFRNQGVGSWEINLAALLADLNTNQWGQVIGNAINGNSTYYYYQMPIGDNQGFAFSDARALLAWRYNNNYRSLASVDNLFGGSTSAGDFAFQNDNIDGYSDGPLQIGLQLPGDIKNPKANDDPSKLWAGADNTNRFFTHQEFFDPAKADWGATLPGFVERLLNAGTNTFGGSTVSTYDRYTFYRLLAQLGTDSTPESGKMNLNYDNLDPGSNGVLTFNGTTSATNFVPWQPLAFFTNAANRLLRAYTTQWRNSNPTNFAATFYAATGFTNIIASQWTTNYLPFGITKIPVLVSNQFVYTPAVNRLLQLAANLYDASTNSFYPSVFRPCFSRDFYGNLFITGYTNIDSVSGVADIRLSTPFDASQVLLPTGTNVFVNVYGVPWIIGAKKGFPGFNQFSLMNGAQFTRKLQVARKSVGGQIWTNQMLTLSVNNNLGVSFWNSYSNDYVGNLTVYVVDSVQAVLTNSDPLATTYSPFFTTNFSFNLTRWPGSKWSPNEVSGTPVTNSFLVNFWINNVLPLAVYNFTTHGFNFATNAQNFWDTNRTVVDPLPQFGLLTTNWLQAFIVDNNHVIDYVQLHSPIDGTNLTAALADPNYPDPFKTGDLQWSTNLNSDGIAYGVINQFAVSESGQNLPVNSSWHKPSNFPPGVPDTVQAEAQFFWGIINPNSTFQVNGVTYSNLELAVQAPYTPSRTVFVPYLYQVNDPVVHYLASDLDAGQAGVWQGNNVVKANGVWGQSDDPINEPLPITPNANNPGIINGHSRYQPWGQTVPSALSTVDYNFGNPYNLIYKDPLVWGPDYWDFPTNKLPTVGWIGRVHRGTPWQTVYLKAHNVLTVTASGTNTWMAWTGNGNPFDAINTAPVQDRPLFDLFTTAFNDNATRGTLSVNQGAGSADPAAGLAAWSALFSGMVALTNTTAMPPFSTTVAFTPTNNWLLIQPAGGSGLYSPLGNLVTNINKQRAVFTNADGVAGAFEHKGDILSTLALTEQSPFLNWNNVNQQRQGISDEVYEWLPQQMMSLLRIGSSPRYVIYCYGQALKPAPDSVVTSSSLLPSGLNPFGMITNYQIVSEIAARAVVRFNSTATNVITTDGTNWFSQPVVTNNNAVIESFNLLPPD